MGPEKESKKSTQTVVHQQLQQQKQQQDQLQQMHNQGAQLATEVRTQATEQKPGFFRRVWNWIKGAFSKLFSGGKNTQTQSGGDAMDTFVESQATAPAPDPVLQTLSPAQTAPDTFKAAEENQDTAQDTLQVDQGTQEASQESQTLAQDLESSRDTQEEPVQVAQAPQIEDGGSLTIGTVTFALCSKQEDGSYLSTEGTAQVLGGQVSWTSKQGVRLDQSNLSSPIQGVIHVAKGALELKNLEVSGGWENLHFAQQEGSEFLYHAGETDLSFVPEGDLDDLSQVTGSKIQVVNRQVPLLKSLPAFKQGTIQITGPKQFELINTQAAVEGVTLPKYLSMEGADLCLYKQGDGAELAIDFHNFNVNMGNFSAINILTAGGVKVRAPIEKSGAVTISFPETTSYQMSMLKGKISQDVGYLFKNMTITLGQQAEMMSLKFQNTECSVGGFHMQDLSLEYRAEQGFLVQVGKVTGMDGKLTASNLAAQVGANGLEIPQFSMEYSGDFGAETQHITFEVNGFQMESGGVVFRDATAQLNKDISLVNNSVKILSGTATLKKQPNLVALDVNATGSFNYKNEYLNFTGKQFSIDLHYAKEETSQVKEGADASPAGGQAAAGRNRVGDFSVNIQGNIQAQAMVNDTRVADVTFQNGITIADGTFTLGSADAYFNLTSLHSAFSGDGTVKAEGVTVGPQGINCTNFLFFAEKPKLFGQELGKRIELSKAQGYCAKVEIDKEISYHIDNVNVDVGLKPNTFVVSMENGQVSPGLEGAELHIQSGGTSIQAKLGSVMIGNPIEIESITLQNENVTNMVKNTLGVENIALVAQGVTIGPRFESFSVKGIGLGITQDFSLFKSNLKLTEVGGSATVADGLSLEGMRLWGTLSYSGSGAVTSLKGTVVLSIQPGGSLRVDKVSGLELALREYASVTVDSVEALEPAGTGLLFNDVSMSAGENYSGGDSEQDLDDSGESLMRSLARYLPEIRFYATKMEYRDGGFQLDPKDVRVKSIQTEIALSDAWKLNLGYEKESQSLSAALNGRDAVPEGRKNNPKETEELFTATVFAFPILPMISFDMKIGVEAGLDYAVGAEAKFASRAFEGAFQANSAADLGVNVSGEVMVGVPGLNIHAGLGAGVNVTANGTINGTVQLQYDPTKPTLKDALFIGQEKTGFGYQFGAELNFDVTCQAGAIVPSVFDATTKSLVKSWNIFHYNLGQATLEGKMYYQDGKVCFDTSSVFVSHPPGKFQFQESLEKLAELEVAAGKIQEQNETVYALLEKHAGVLGLGEVRDALRIKQSILIMNILNGNLKEAATRYHQVREELHRIEKKLPEILELSQHTKRIRKDTAAAAQLSGITVHQEGNQTVADKGWNAFLSELQVKRNDPQYMEQLARLDPLAVFNTFKAYKQVHSKLSGVSWERHYKTARQLSKDMRATPPSTGGVETGGATSTTTAEAGKGTTASQEGKSQRHEDGPKPLNKKTKGLLDDYLNSINQLLGDSFAQMKASNVSLHDLVSKLNEAEGTKRKKQVENFNLAQEMDTLDLEIKKEKATGNLNNKNKIVDLEKKRAELSKNHAASRVKLEELAQNCTALEKQIAEERDNAVKAAAMLHGKKEGVYYYSGLAKEWRAQEKLVMETQKKSIEAKHMQEVSNLQWKNNMQFVCGLLDLLLESRAGAISDTSEQAKQVNERAAVVAEGGIIEERIKSEFMENIQGKSAEEWEKLYEDYYQNGETFDNQYQKALDLYYDLTKETFHNKDDEDQAEVARQNNLLRKTCQALKTDLSPQSLKIHEKGPEEINKKMAKLQKSVATQ